MTFTFRDFGQWRIIIIFYWTITTIIYIIISPTTHSPNPKYIYIYTHSTHIYIYLLYEYNMYIQLSLDPSSFKGDKNKSDFCVIFLKYNILYYYKTSSDSSGYRDIWLYIMCLIIYNNAWFSLLFTWLV